MTPYRERAVAIYERRRRGENWKEIAAAVGVTRERAQQIAREHEQWLSGHIRAWQETGQPLEAIADAYGLDLPLTRELSAGPRVEALLADLQRAASY